MPIELTADFVRSAIGIRHPNQKECEELANKLEIHAKGLKPEVLINKRRPSESEKVKDYRKEIYVPITKKSVGKVINSLSKIRRSQDWNIQYDGDSVPKTIKSDETLEAYCEKNYPKFTSLTNWAFNELLIRSLIDANSVCAVILKTLPENAAEYVKPEVEIFGSKQILSYSPDEYYALLSTEVAVYKNGNNRSYQGKVYYIITDTQIARYEERGGRGLEQTLIYNHHFGELPVFKVGGVYFDRKNNDIIQESRIAPMIPFLDEAVREYSDLQAEIVQHIHSEKYIYTNTECPACKGTGISTEKDADGNFKKCPKCNGTGNITSVSPYGEYLITAGRKLDEYQLPTPPIGYVQKSTDIAKLQDERVRNHIYDALSAINMEFLAETPLNQSGTAKEVDRDELNTFVNSVAEDIVMVLDRVYYFICRYRYSVIVPDKSKRDKMLPVIAVPERFDLLNTSVLVNDIQTAKNANVNPMLIKYMEIELARKKYNAEPQVAYEVECMFELDPLYGYSQDDKMTMLSNSGITERDYVISCNISQFIQKAFKDEKDFNKKSFDERKKIISGYAEEIIKENSVKDSLKTGILEQLNPKPDEQS
jgi:hypothetical protein